MAAPVLHWTVFGCRGSGREQAGPHAHARDSRQGHMGVYDPLRRWRVCGLRGDGESIRFDWSVTVVFFATVPCGNVHTGLARDRCFLKA
jgi:hypothetical protein